MADASKLSIIALVDPDVIAESSPGSRPELLARVIAIEEKRQAAKPNAARGKRIERLKAEQARRAGQPDEAGPISDELIERYAREVGPRIIERFKAKIVVAIFMRYAPKGHHGGAIIMVGVTFQDRTGVQVELEMKTPDSLLDPIEVVGKLADLDSREECQGF